jgi:hypothetical protein
MPRINLPIVLAAAIMWSWVASPTQAADPLAIAKQLATTTYQGWTYGDDPTQKKINCVQFVLAIVQEALMVTLDEGPRNQILIANLSAAETAMLPLLITSDDPKIKGVQQALVDLQKGTAVTFDQAQPGDLIQYWMKKTDGNWMGHSGVIETVGIEGGVLKAGIFSASETLNGIGSSPDGKKLRLINDPDNRRLYLVRLK